MNTCSEYTHSHSTWHSQQAELTFADQTHTCTCIRIHTHVYTHTLTILMHIQYSQALMHIQMLQLNKQRYSKCIHCKLYSHYSETENVCTRSETEREREGGEGGREKESAR